MGIYLVRHTTPNIEKGICYGQTDLNITATFEEEFDKIKQQIPLQKEIKLYSSPLLRCKVLAESFDKEVIYDDRLKELDFGDWEMKAWDAIPKKELDPWMQDFVNVAVPNGESYVQLWNRVKAFFSAIDDIDQQIIIVTHAGPMRAILAHHRRILLKDSFSIKIKYGEVFKI